MGYTAVKGGLEAIEAAERLIESLPTDADESTLEIRQLCHQLGAAVDKVIGEGGVYAPELAAQAIRQTEGDLFEAAFVLRAYRSTLPRLGYAEAVRGEQMRLRRRISSAFRDIPGGQLLGRTRDYTQRLLDLSPFRSTNGSSDGDLFGADRSAFEARRDENPSILRSAGHDSREADTEISPNGKDAAERLERAPKIAEVLRRMGLLPVAEEAQHTAGSHSERAAEPPDLTRESMRFPVTRPAWLQALARGESGAVVCLAYSSLRGYGGRADHGTIAELRVGDLPLRVAHPLTGEAMTVGWFKATEVEMVGGEHDASRKHAAYGLSYGLVFGQHERKAIAMALLDSALQAAVPEDGEPAPANDQEMVLSHIDGIESFGFVEHLKLPHFVTFGASLRISAKLTAETQDPTELHHHGDGVLHSHA